MKIATFGLFCLTVFLGLFPNVKAEASYRPPAYHAPAYRPAPVYRPPVYHAPRVQRGPVYRQPQAHADRFIDRRKDMDQFIVLRS